MQIFRQNRVIAGLACIKYLNLVITTQVFMSVYNLPSAVSDTVLLQYQVNCKTPVISNKKKRINLFLRFMLQLLVL